MRRAVAVLTLGAAVLSLAVAHDEPSAACTKALQECENDLECQNRLAPLMAACTTGTCQPQCRSAVLNVYQNKFGRALLRSDASCIPGREELRTCNFLPTGSAVHCSLSKLACEADLQCNAKWGVYVSECESEAAQSMCSSKCRSLLAAVTETTHGAAFANCTCTQREDQLCQSLRDKLLGACLKESSGGGDVLLPGDNSVTDAPAADTAEVGSTSSTTLPLLLLAVLFVVRFLVV